MNVARLSDGLLSASSTMSLIGILSAQSGGMLMDDLIRELSAKGPISRSRARNTIAKLSAYQIIRAIEPAGITLNADESDDWHALVVRQIALDVMSVLNRADGWSCFRLEPHKGSLIIDAMTLPAMTDGLGTWITDFGLAKRPAVQERYWTVAEEHCELFMSGARAANLRPPRCARTIEQLKAERARQAADEAAEIWVLEFEQRRLEGHPLRDQIRRVPKDDVWAGYNIVSFASLRSLQHDMFIAVKTYHGSKSFHWARNEIMTALEFNEAYALYLVDLEAFTEQGYAPHMIRGPTPSMFMLPESGWQVEATSFDNISVQLDRPD